MPALAVSSPTLMQRYFDAWNDHDADALVACFAPDGSYSDPAAGDGLSGEPIATYARELWTAFPDLRFEVVSANACGVAQVAVQWVMRGTNAGSYRGHAPTARSLALSGAAFIRVSPDGIRSVQSYFDTGALRRQLDIGLGTPAAVGPFSFGAATKLHSGRKKRPGALTVTTLRAGHGATPETVREAGFEIGQDLLGRPGFISMVAAAVGGMLTTITAWDSPEAARQQRDQRHGEVVAQFFPPATSTGGTTTVWAPIEGNALWVRCARCGTVAETQGPISNCGCGARLPEAPTVW